MLNPARSGANNCVGGHKHWYRNSGRPNKPMLGCYRLRLRNVYRHVARSRTHHCDRADDPNQLRARSSRRTNHDGGRLLRCRIRGLDFIHFDQCARRGLDGRHLF